MKKNNFGLNFYTTAQQIFFEDFFRFLPSAGGPFDVVVKNNTAFIGFSDKKPRMCVFPSDDSLLHFEFSTDFSKDIDLNTSFPYFCSSNDDLGIAKLLTQYVFSLKFDQKFAVINENTTKMTEKNENSTENQVSEKKEPEKKDENTNVIKLNNKSNSISDRLIWKYF